VIVGNTFGLYTQGGSAINADSNVLVGNNFAVVSSLFPTPGLVRLSNNDVYDNLTGFYCTGGVIASNGTNRKGNNTGGGYFPCTPTETITQQ
jgi:hypothetical protein